jgi:hypothetical protein
MQDMLGYTLPIEVVVCALSQINADVDILGIEDVLDSEFDLKLEEGVLFKVKRDVVLDHDFYIKGKLDS